MVGAVRSSYPDGLSPVDPGNGGVRELQRKLWVAAKRSPGRRFHALFDRVFRSDVLWEAWMRVQKNKGAAGVDAQTLAEVREYGAERLLAELQRDLCQGVYRPRPVRRVLIPKPKGGVRPLGIPTVKDRIVQQAARMILEPIFEADFLEVSFGFRPRRSATDAKEVLRRSFIDGYRFVFEADIRDYFSAIVHERLLGKVAERVSGWSCTGRRRGSLTSERAGKAWISLAATSTLACRAGCWSAASAATTFSAGPPRRR